MNWTNRETPAARKELKKQQERGESLSMRSRIAAQSDHTNATRILCFPAIEQSETGSICIFEWISTARTTVFYLRRKIAKRIFHAFVMHYSC